MLVDVDVVIAADIGPTKTAVVAGVREVGAVVEAGSLA